MTETQRKREKKDRERERKREKERQKEIKKERERKYYPTVIILRVPSIKIPDFFAQHRPERDRHRLQNNQPFILDYDTNISGEIITRNYDQVYYDTKVNNLQRYWCN